ncbi:MAG: hypothetical protein KGS28_10785 [Betaproteobacteria bacterium]|nr:hypothetical protein [Betaproteobacteria bacterium]
MDDLIWIIAIVCIGMAIGVPSWLIVQAAERLTGRNLDHKSLYGWAALIAFAAMFMLPSGEHTTHLQNFFALVKAFSGGAIIGSLLSIVYQWTLKGSEVEKRLAAISGKHLGRLLENKIVSMILGGVLAVVLVIAGMIIVGVRMDGVPLFSPLASWLWDAIRSLH